MTITINGNGTVTGVSVGGLPDGIVDTDMLAANAVVTGKITDGTIAAGDIAGGVIPAGGITEHDTWRITSAFQGDADPITSNWERADRSTQGHLGTGMSQSSGVFTFPSTGWWEVTFTAEWFYSSDSRYGSTTIQGTIDNGSNWLQLANASDGIYPITGGANAYASCTTTSIFDVTDVSNVKARFSVGVEDNSMYTQGSSNINHTYVTFIRLGDT